MASNISSVRVQITGDSRGLNAELLKASKSVADFGNRNARSNFRGLDSQLSQVQKQITEVAESYVTGGKVQRAEIEKLIGLEKRLKNQIEARNTAISAARGDIKPLPTGNPLDAFFQPSMRGGPAQVRQLNTELATTTQRSGRASFVISQLGFAAEDAAVTFGNQGLSGALRAAGNNLSVVASVLNPLAGVVVGVGTALAAILVPRLLETSDGLDEIKKSAEQAKRALLDTARVSDSFRSSVERLSTDDLGIGDSVNLNKFDEQRQSFKDLLKGYRQDIRDFSREAKTELMPLRASGIVDPENFAGERAIDSAVRVNRTGVFFRSARKQLLDAFNEAASTGDLLPLVNAKFSILGEERRIGSELGIDSAKFREVIDEQILVIEKLATESFLATERVGKLNGEISKLSGRENAARVSEALLTPLFQVGGRFPGLLNNLTRGFQADFGGVSNNDRRNALAQSDPLQAGFQFGSLEAISAINRATFSRPDPVEKDIEKNTSQTVTAVQDVVTEVKNLGTAITTGIGNAIVSGASL